MMQSGLIAAAESLTLRFVDSLIEGAVVCLLTWLILRILPRQNAASRFAVWFTALMAIALGPVLGSMWPSAQIAGHSMQKAAIKLPETWAVYFVAAWVVVSLYFLTGLTRSLWHLRRLRRSCVPLDPAALDPVLQETLRRHSGTRIVALCTSSQIKVPAAIGFWNPTIVVPDWAFRELSSDELNQIVLHELAHVRRLDDWTNLTQQIIKALFFFHPGIWWIERKASLEREMACDDAVLAATARPRAYAECLARLAEKSFVHRSLAMAQAALGKVRQVSDRVAQILDCNRPNGTAAIWRPAASLVVVVAIGSVIWSSQSRRLIAFETEGPARQTTTVTETGPELLQTPIPMKVTAARLTEKRQRPHPLSSKQTDTLRATTPVAQAKSMIHLASAKPPAVPITETMLIVFQHDESDLNYRVLQIQMWHVTIFRDAAADSTQRIPRKI